MKIDVTDLVDFGEVDDECLPLTKCICGKTWPNWEFVISIYENNAYSCDSCGRKFCFSNKITVYEVKE